MNPWALLVIIIGIVLVITGVKGTQHNIGSVITGKGQQPSGTPGTKPKPGPKPPTRTVPPVAPM